MIRVGIIGCGIISDAHLDIIRHFKNVEVVGVCDREELMAWQMCERYPISGYYSDVNAFLEKARPEVVHITTPPASHFELAKICLEAGSHVYIEKPFTLDTATAKELIDLCIEKGKKLTVGHDATFNFAERRMRKLIGDGYLGGPPQHMESYYCYDLGDTYAKALAADPNHWVRKLPGKLLHNIISHGICKIAEHLSGENTNVIAHGFTSATLKNLGENEIIDELRVVVNDGNQTTAYFTFSSQLEPPLHLFRIFGPNNGLVVDHNNQTCLKLKGDKYKSYLDVFYPPIQYSKQYASNFMVNMYKFLRNDLHMKSGMKYLIESFYNSIQYDRKPPIPYNEIILTSKIMDSIFKQLRRGGCHGVPI